VQVNLKDFEINVNLSFFFYPQDTLFFYSLAGFESFNLPRQTSGNTNNNRSDGGLRQGGRGGNQQNDYYENGYNDGKKNFYFIIYVVSF